MSVRERQRSELEERSRTFNPDDYDIVDPEEHPPDLEAYYGSLKNYVRMVTGGYSNLLMLDAKGGLGKTHNVKAVLREELEPDQWTHLKGFTTPIELYKSLYMAQENGHIIFLDDMSGITSNTKAVDMLKSATDTEGSENWVEYRTSRDIDHPRQEGATLPNTFCFRGRMIMSFNETPDNRHFDALKDRGTYHQLSFTYDERLELITEVAKIDSFSNLSVREQQEVAEWIKIVTDPSMEVSIRTFEEVCQMRKFGQDRDEDWERLALDVFDVDYDKFLILRMRRDTDLSVEEQVSYFEQETDKSRSTYYRLLEELKDA